jgi:hypothetical protein
VVQKQEDDQAAYERKEVAKKLKTADTNLKRRAKAAQDKEKLKEAAALKAAAADTQS